MSFARLVAFGRLMGCTRLELRFEGAWVLGFCIMIQSKRCTRIRFHPKTLAWGDVSYVIAGDTDPGGAVIGIPGGGFAGTASGDIEGFVLEIFLPYPTKVIGVFIAIRIVFAEGDRTGEGVTDEVPALTGSPGHCYEPTVTERV